MAEEDEVEKSRKRYKEFIGLEVKSGGKFKVSQKKIESYCEAVGQNDPRYMDENYPGGQMAPPEAAAMYGMGAWSGLMSLRGLVTNFGKLLHAGQSFEYLEPIRVGDELTTKEAKILDVYEKANMLWIVFESSLYNQNDTRVAISRGTAGIRSGGYKKM
ncbi:MAG: MaoC family dehydratase N-terminal domain-containing protein [Halobacteriota archaeon]|nr:MaoC family dehydratase N-terminal domain-containing protein [Halobacteriota archaeon]